MTSKLKSDTAESAVGLPIIMVAIANPASYVQSGWREEIFMRLGIPLIAFSLCTLAGYAEVRSQSKSGPNGFALVDKSGNISKPAGVRDTERHADERREEVALAEP